ncbi:MAG: nitroreductase family protein [Candidatus Thorarchaeota archaeon]
MTNKFNEKIRSRSSIRKFASGQVPEDVVHEIIETGIRAPSAGNRQPWRIVTVRSEETKLALASAAYNQTFMADADIILVVCAVPSESAERYGKRGETLYVLQDTAALTTTILLAVHNLGLGACWIGAFDEAEVSRILNIPKEMRPVSMIPIGQIKTGSEGRRPRKPVADIVISESF